MERGFSAAPTESEFAFLERFATVTRAAILTEFGPDSCVASTRIGIEVLRYFGYPEAKPEAVRFYAHTADYDPGAPDVGWSIGVTGTGAVSTGPGGRPRWDGHLVIVLPDRRVLIDLSLDQASRPARGLVLEPLVGPLDRSWVDTGEVVFARSEDDAVVVYQRTGDRGYRTAADWAGPPDRRAARRRVVARAVRELRS